MVRTSKTGAGNGIRTRDPQLGRLTLYQLSYSRPSGLTVLRLSELTAAGVSDAVTCFLALSGEGRIRTSVGLRRQIYSLLPLATRAPPRIHTTLVWGYKMEHSRQAAEVRSHMARAGEGI